MGAPTTKNEAVAQLALLIAIVLICIGAAVLGQ